MPVKQPQPGDLDPIETASREEIAALQLQRLKWSLQHAYDNVPHYRKKFDDKGVHPNDLNTLADIAKFPFTTKADLRDNYPFGMFAVPRTQVARVHASSGTTGKPTVVGYTLKDIDTWANLVARSIRGAGGRPGDICHVAYGYGLFTGGLGAHYGAERAGCTVIPMSWRADGKAGPADHGLQARHHHGHAVVLAGDCRRVCPPGRGPRGHFAQSRHLRRRALGRRHACADRARPGLGCGGHLRPVRGDGPRRGQRVH
jgi:hypothetical protein